MFIKTEAIVLRVHPWSNTSHLVVWLTPEHGRVSTRVKGACRPKSLFLGQYDLCYTCELLFYARETGGVHSIREVSPLDTRDPLRFNWRSACAANYYADLAHHASVPMQEARSHYELLRRDLDALCHDIPRPVDILLHEARVLKLLGLAPNLAPCPACHGPEQSVRYSVTAARPLCEHTRPAAATDTVLTLPPGVLQALGGLFNATETSCFQNSPWGVPLHALNGEKFLLAIFRFFGTFMRLHIEYPMGPRRTLFDLFASLPRPKPLVVGGV